MAAGCRAGRALAAEPSFTVATVTRRSTRATRATRYASSRPRPRRSVRELPRTRPAAGRPRQPGNSSNDRGRRTATDATHVGTCWTPTTPTIAARPART